MTTKQEKETKEKTVTKTRSPFKDKKLLEKEITSFINKFKTTVVNQSSRISDYFEMCCFNHIVKFYEYNGYKISVEGLQANKYRYKCSTSGIQSNFSHFRITKKIGESIYDYEIQHNLAIQSAYDSEIFTTPDISIIKANSVKTIVGFYESKTRFSHVVQDDIITFCEVKQFNPFPELIFNFIGVVNELKPNVLENKYDDYTPTHIAPSLMISGKPNKHTLKIKDSLETRYCINIIYDIFYNGRTTFAKTNIKRLRKLCEQPPLATVYDDLDNPPF